MKKRLSKMGTSKGIVLDKTLIKLMGLKEGDQEVSIRVENKELIISAVQEEK